MAWKANSSTKIGIPIAWGTNSSTKIGIPMAWGTNSSTNIAQFVEKMPRALDLEAQFVDENRYPFCLGHEFLDENRYPFCLLAAFGCSWLALLNQLRTYASQLSSSTVLPGANRPGIHLPSRSADSGNPCPRPSPKAPPRLPTVKCRSYYSVSYTHLTLPTKA